MVRLVSALLVLAYLFALVMSAGHLSEWYRLTLGSLPSWFAVGLATALEASAFLLSLLSNSILKASRWANWGALVALGLVWVGNYMSMLRAAGGIPAYEVFLSSLFVPVSTYVVAKVLGELQTLNSEASGVNRVSRGEPKRVSPEASEGEPVSPVRTPEVSGGEPLRVSPVNPEVSPEEPREVSSENTGEVSSLEAGPVVSWGPDLGGGVSPNGAPKVSQGGYARYLELLDSPKTIAELAQLASVSKPAARKALRFLEAQGLVEAREGRWVRKDAHMSGELGVKRGPESSGEG